eukprot:3669022-Amphidinium_carterae.1
MLHPEVFSATVDDPMVESITFSGELRSTWPASVAPRYHPAMDLPMNGANQSQQDAHPQPVPH